MDIIHNLLPISAIHACHILTADVIENHLKHFHSASTQLTLIMSYIGYLTVICNPLLCNCKCHGRTSSTARVLPISECLLCSSLFFYHLFWQYSLPMPKGGKHGRNPILVEDQREAKRFSSKMSKKKLNPLHEDYNPGECHFSPYRHLANGWWTDSQHNIVFKFKGKAHWCSGLECQSLEVKSWRQTVQTSLM